MKTSGDVGDPKAILENSGSFNMQALRFEPCQVNELRGLRAPLS
jgi:hypothetical protein